jgi:Tfp pilus assembly protein PilV
MKHRLEQGISLIEALVAVAVMGFGLLGLLGLQSTLRTNADLSKQRSQAVRMANEQIEEQRVYSVLDTTVGSKAWDDITTIPVAAVTGVLGMNATFNRTLTVTNLPIAGQALSIAPYKTIRSDVVWRDRSDQDQTVTISTHIVASAPEVMGALAASGTGSPVQQAGGRDARIPPGAVDQGDGTSTFDPPGAAGVSWTFNNVTGIVQRVCVSGVCTNVNARLLSGFVRFALGTVTAPTGVEAEVPPSTAFLVGAAVDINEAGPGLNAYTQLCYVGLSGSSAVAYYCLIEFEPTRRFWSGRSGLYALPLPIATNIADASAGKYRVCRYTTERSQAAVGPTLSNEQHPYEYANVRDILTGQNFLVINAGDGTTAFDCPDDNTATRLVNGRTWHHQPAS